MDLSKAKPTRGKEHWGTGSQQQGIDLCFSCSQHSNLLNVTAWDIATGAALKTYSCDYGRSSANTTLRVGSATSISLLGRNYLLCASNTVPFIYVWNLKKEQLQTKISCVGLVGALACSPEGTYCAAAIGEKIHVWEVCTGHLLAVVEQHYQPISVLRFTDDGSHLLSGGGDARVVVWSVSSVLSEAYKASGSRIPFAPPLATPFLSHSSSSVTRHVWSDHSLPVTDIYCGAGGLRSRVATVSLDQTCKMYELCSGQLLCSFLFDFGLTCVIMDLAEHWLFVGGSNGDIAQINLFSKFGTPFQSLSHSAERERKNVYKGHSKPITGLAVGRWNHLLVSTSEEDSARVWDIASLQCLRTIKLKGPVSCMLTTGDTLHLSATQGAPVRHIFPPTLQPFKKRLYYSSSGTNSETGRDEGPVSDSGRNGTRQSNDVVPINLGGIDLLSDLSLLKHYECCFIPPLMSTSTSQSDTTMSTHAVQQELSEIMEVHKELYSYVVRQTIGD